MPTEPERRPSFAERYPRDPALESLVEAFARGDFGHVRTEAPKLAASTDDEIVRAAALDLRARIEPEIATKWVFAGTAALLAFLVAWFYLHRLP